MSPDLVQGHVLHWVSELDRHLMPFATISSVDGFLISWHPPSQPLLLALHEWQRAVLALTEWPRSVLVLTEWPRSVLVLTEWQRGVLALSEWQRGVQALTEWPRAVQASKKKQQL